MALTKCPECDTQVSDKAEKCPNCAYPVASKLGDKVQTIEQTGKKYKLRMLISAILVGIGVVITFASTMPIIQIAGAVLAFAGFIFFIVTKIYIWWHHR